MRDAYNAHTPLTLVYKGVWLMSARNAAWRPDVLLENGIKTILCCAPGSEASRTWSRDVTYLSTLNINDVHAIGDKSRILSGGVLRLRGGADDESHAEDGDAHFGPLADGESPAEEGDAHLNPYEYVEWVPDSSSDEDPSNESSSSRVPTPPGGLAGTPVISSEMCYISVSIQGEREEVLWLHHTSSFAEALVVYLNRPWCDEWEDLFLPTIGGLPVGWDGYLDSVLLRMWGDTIVFVPIGRPSGLVGAGGLVVAGGEAIAAAEAQPWSNPNPIRGTSCGAGDGQEPTSEDEPEAEQGVDEDGVHVRDVMFATSSETAAATRSRLMQHVVRIRAWNQGQGVPGSPTVIEEGSETEAGPSALSAEQGSRTDASVEEIQDDAADGAAAEGGWSLFAGWGAYDYARETQGEADAQPSTFPWDWTWSWVPGVHWSHTGWENQEQTNGGGGGGIPPHEEIPTTPATDDPIFQRPRAQILDMSGLWRRVWHGRPPWRQWNVPYTPAASSGVAPLHHSEVEQRGRDLAAQRRYSWREVQALSPRGMQGWTESNSPTDSMFVPTSLIVESESVHYSPTVIASEEEVDIAGDAGAADNASDEYVATEVAYDTDEYEELVATAHYI